VKKEYARCSIIQFLCAVFARLLELDAVLMEGFNDEETKLLLGLSKVVLTDLLVVNWQY
jgi:molybdopterin-guanine dinucleotide biosynthesis protein